jgi:hypothetical protein
VLPLPWATVAGSFAASNPDPDCDAGYTGHQPPAGRPTRRTRRRIRGRRGGSSGRVAVEGALTRRDLRATLIASPMPSSRVRVHTASVISPASTVGMAWRVGPVRSACSPKTSPGNTKEPNRHGIGGMDTLYRVRSVTPNRESATTTTASAGITWTAALRKGSSPKSAGPRRGRRGRRLLDARPGGPHRRGRRAGPPQPV